MEVIKTKKNTLRSGHHTGTHVTADGLSLTENIRGETGRVDINGTIDRGVTAEIEFRKEYVDPVVVAYIITRRGGQSIEVRVKDVTKTGCTIFLEEPDDENHNPETISYIVMESGSHITKTGYRIEAGIHETTTSRHKSNWRDFVGDEIKFPKIFTEQPVVLHTLNTYRNTTFASTMAQNVTVDGFELSQEFAETNKNSANEVIGWIAFTPMAGKGFITDVKGEVGIAEATQNTGVDNKPGTTIDFRSGFVSRPDAVVKGQTMNGNNGYWARSTGAWSKDLIRVYAEEDQVSDRERAHTSETFGYAAFENNSTLMTIRQIGNRVSDIYELDTIDIRYPLVTTWKSDNYSSMIVEAKVSADYGVTWSDWLPCEYAKPVPGLPITGELDGYSVQFKYTLVNDTDVPVHVKEFSVKTDGTPVIIEGLNVGGYAKDGTEWNQKRIFF